MEYTHLLLREGELFLKGKNASAFERRLAANLRAFFPGLAIQQGRGRMTVAYFTSHWELRKVFGLVSYSPAVQVQGGRKSGEKWPEDIGPIKAACLQLLVSQSLQRKITTFKIQTKRSDKSFPKTSLQVNAEIGRHIEQSSSLHFHPLEQENILHIEINHQGIFVFSEVIPCVGGLPVGIEGNVSLLLEDERSLLAGLLMMKRGCSVIPIPANDQNHSFSLLKSFYPQLSSFPGEILNGGNDTSVLVTGDLLFSKRKDAISKVPGNSIILKPLISYTPEQVKEELLRFKVLVDSK